MNSYELKRHQNQEAIMDFLMDPMPLSVGATVRQISGGTGLTVGAVHADLRILVDVRKLVVLLGQQRSRKGGGRPALVFAMRRTPKARVA